MILIIDGNSMLNVTASVVLYTYRSNSNFDLSYVTIDDKIMLKESSSAYFKNFILKYINSVVIPMRYRLTEIYFAFDNMSWRKFYVQKYFERRPQDPNQFAYKSNRKVDLNRKELTLYFDYFKEKMMPELRAIPGVKSIMVKGAEGDDVIAVLCNDIKGEKIVWSGDSDMNQVVTDDDNGYTVVIGPKNQATKLKRLVVPPPRINLNLLDFSVDNMDLRGFVKHLAADKEYEMLTVHPGEYVLGKIIMGDSTDTIPSIYVHRMKNNKPMRITERRLARIMEPLLKLYNTDQFMQKIDSMDPTFINTVVDCTMQGLNAPAGERQNIKDNLLLNTRLVRLNMNNIPQEMTKVIRYEREISNPAQFDYQNYIEYANVK